MSHPHSTSRTTIILDFRRGAKVLREIIDRYSLPSEKILRPCILYAFYNLHCKRHDTLLTTFFFQAGDLTEALLIPRVDSGEFSTWVYLNSDQEIEKKKQELFLDIQGLSEYVERQLSSYNVSVPRCPDDLYSVYLRGDSLYLNYFKSPLFGGIDEENVRTGTS